MFGSIEVYATTPESEPQELKVGSDSRATAPTGAEYRQQVIDGARWAEASGCAGTLIYTNNTLVDGWSVAQLVLDHTERLRPLVAVQPILMSAYGVAKKLTTFAHLFGRRVDINMVAGGFPPDLQALCDPTPHDERYERIVEYTRLINDLLAGDEPVSVDGRHVQAHRLSLMPPMPAELRPLVTMAGSSPASRDAAAAVGATAVMYPEPIEMYTDDRLWSAGDCGARVGIIARDTTEEAWDVALARFPDDRRGRKMHAMANNISESSWHKRLSTVAGEIDEPKATYWLGPFETYKTFCPYYVGTYDDVAAELAGLMRLGARLFILDIMLDEAEYAHTAMAFERAVALADV